MIVEKKLFFAWQLDKEKKYLEEKAKEGYKLKKVTLGKYYFEETEPKNLVYQFDFRMFSRKEEKEYLDLFEDWEFIFRFGGWYYFCKESSNENESIFSNVESKRNMFLRLIGFLLLTGFPLYYQTIILLPNLEQDGGLSKFYLFFRPIVYLFLLLHSIAIINVALIYNKMRRDIRE